MISKNIIKMIKKLTIIVMINLFLSPNALSADLTWIGGDSTWETNGNWSEGAVPTDLDDVTITNATVTLSNGELANFNSLTLGDGANLILIGDINSGANITIEDGGTLTQQNTTQQIITGDFEIQSGGVLTHADNSDQQSYIVNFATNNFDLQNNSSINVDYLGYDGGVGYNNSATLDQNNGVDESGDGDPDDENISNSDNVDDDHDGKGPGGAILIEAYGAGGGHGGSGGQPRGNGDSYSLKGESYCSIDNVSTMGSGGSGATSSDNGGEGGGLVILEVTNTFTFDGTISAKGRNAYHYYAGGGAGGGIKITADTITTVDGNPTLDVSGGSNSWNSGGTGGGGGCVQVIYTTDNSIEIDDINLDGGNTPQSAYEDGGAGVASIEVNGENPILYYINSRNNPAATSIPDSTLKSLHLDTITGSIGTVTISDNLIFSGTNELTLTNGKTLTYSGDNDGIDDSGDGELTLNISGHFSASNLTTLTSLILLFDGTSRYTNPTTITIDSIDNNNDAVFQLGDGMTIDNNFTTINAGGNFYLYQGANANITTLNVDDNTTTLFDFDKDNALSLTTLAVDAGATLTHAANSTSPDHTVNISATNITIDGTVNVDEKGFAGGEGFERFDSLNQNENTSNSDNIDDNRDGKGPGGGLVNQVYGAGGGHASKGGTPLTEDNLTSVAGSGYCSLSDIQTMGSGGSGGSGDDVGGAGGGLIKLIASDTLTINGTLSANGQRATAYYAGGGAGGGIHLDADTIAVDTPTISATGGNTSNSSGASAGSGGCVQIAYTTSNGVIIDEELVNALTFDDLDISGGNTHHGSVEDGGPGFAFIKPDGEDADYFLGSDAELNNVPSISIADLLAVDNLRFDSVNADLDNITVEEEIIFNGTNSISVDAGNSFTIEPNSITNNGTVTLNISGTLTATNITSMSSTNLNLLDGSTFNNAASFTVDGTSTLSIGDGSTIANNLTTLSIGGDSTIHQGATFTLATLTITENTLTLDSFDVNNALSVTTFNIESGGILTSSDNTDTANHVVNVSATNMTIDQNGSINVDDKGFSGGSGFNGTANIVDASDGDGPGGGQAVGVYGAGGAHAFDSGTPHTSNNLTSIPGSGYCDLSDVDTMGSGGSGGTGNDNGGDGGGYIRLNISDTLTINGSISAIGERESQSYSSGGAGGGIKIIADTIDSDTGTIDISGGSTGNSGGSGGSGGCAQIIVNTINDDGLSISDFTYSGGNSISEDAEDGGPGAVVFEIGNNDPEYYFSSDQTNSPTVDFPNIAAITDLEIDGSNFNISNDVTITNLSLSGTSSLTIPNGQTLTINGNTTNSGSASFDVSGTLTATNLTTIDGMTITFNDGSTYNNPNTLHLNDDSTMTFSDGMTISQAFTTLETEGTLNLYRGSNISIGTLDIQENTTTLYDYDKDNALLVTTLEIEDGGILTHEANDSSADHTVNIDAVNLTIFQGGLIDVDAKGFAGGDSFANNNSLATHDDENPQDNTTNSDGIDDDHDGKGPGGGIARSYYGAGGAHAFRGGIPRESQDFSSNPQDGYCSLTDLVTMGSGGSGGAASATGGAGGGLVILDIEETLTLNGGISAAGETKNANADQKNAGAGAGGGIKIIADTIAGTAESISVAGGNTSSSVGASGGSGGCIQVSYTTNNTISYSDGNISLSGGATVYSADGITDGGAGVLWIKQGNNDADYFIVSDQTASEEIDLSVIENINTLTLDGVSLSFDDQTLAGNLILSNTTSITVPENKTLTLNGNPGLTNSGTSTITVIGTLSASNFQSFEGITASFNDGSTFGNNASLSIDADSILTFNSGSTVSNQVSITSSGNINYYQGLTINHDDLTINDGTVTLYDFDVNNDLELGDLVINDGTLTHGDNDDSQDHILNISANSLNLSADAEINVDGLGYEGGDYVNGNAADDDHGNGPGGGTALSSYGSGAGHAGNGGLARPVNDEQANPGSSYCSASNIVTMGSGGAGGQRAHNNNAAGYGGDGGGLIIINTSGAMTLNGSITAQGTNSQTYGGGGSGGGIRLSANQILGDTPSLDVSGGNGGGSGGGAGSGGCVQVNTTLENNVLTDDDINTAGGTANQNDAENGGAGFYFVQLGGETQDFYFSGAADGATSDLPEIVTANLNLEEASFNISSLTINGTLTLTGETELIVADGDSFTISEGGSIDNQGTSTISINGGTFTATDLDTLDGIDLNINTNGTYNNSASLHLNDDSSLTLSSTATVANDFTSLESEGDLDIYQGADITIEDLTIQDGTFTLYNYSLVDSFDVTNFIMTGGTATHADNTNVQTHIFYLTASEDINIGENGTVSVSGLGYDAENSPVDSDGEGQTEGNIGSGGGHFGPGATATADGGLAGGSSYCDFDDVDSMGAGGGAGDQVGSSGGGLIILDATGSATLNGTIVANGIDGQASRSGGGAGGGVKLIADTFIGDPTIAADGGATNGNAGSGGGGCVQVEFTSNNSITIDNISAAGGNGGRQGVAGSIFIKDTDDDYGDLYFINPTDNDTFGSLALSDLTVKSLTLTEVDINLDDITVENGLTLSEATSITIDDGSTLTLGSTLTVSDSSSFDIDGGLVIPEDTNINNNGSLTLDVAGTLTATGWSSIEGSTLNFEDDSIFNNDADLTIADGSTLNLNANGVDVANDLDSITNSGNLYLSDNANFNLASLTIADGEVILSDFTTDNALDLDALTMTGGELTHAANDDAQSHILNISANSIDIQDGASINVDGKGFAPANALNSAGQGTGAGDGDGVGFASGGSHGGVGGDSSLNDNSGDAYCDGDDVATIGSSGGNGDDIGGAGGGLVILAAVNSINIDGTITADGDEAAGNGGGAGAGGGIRINAPDITGEPNEISVVGGASAHANAGGGAGGCLEIDYVGSSTIGEDDVTVEGGNGFGDGGSAGVFSSTELGITISETLDSTDITEGNETDTYSLVLDMLPSDDVVISITSNNTDSGCEVDSAQLTFTTQNWNVAQEVAVSAVDDALHEGGNGGACIISHSISSNDESYDAHSVGSVTPNITDNDAQPQIDFANTEINTSEDEDSLTVTINLSAVSGVDSVFDYNIAGTAINDGTDYTLANGPITIEAGDGSATLNIELEDDNLDEDNETIVLTLISQDNVQDGDDNQTTITLADNDASQLTVTATGDDTRVTEGGDTDTLNLVLSAEPTEDVVVTVSLDDEIEVDADEFTFTAENWDEVQVMTITSVDDDFVEGDHVSTLTFTMASDDENYDELSSQVNSIIIDNDAAGISVSQTDGDTQITEDGNEDQISYVLTTPQEVEDVVITFSVQGNCSLDEDSLTFTSDNWDQSQSITISATDDNIDSDNAGCSISHIISSDDEEYDGYEIDEINIVRVDDDSAGISVVAENLNVTTSGETSSYSIVLTSQPISRVIISLTPGAGVDTDLEQLIFNAQNWDTPQEIEISESDSELNAGSVSHQVSSEDVRYNDYNIANVQVTIVDDIPEEEDQAEEENSPVELLANAGRNRTVLVGNSINLNASNSTGENLSYFWEIIVGVGTLSVENDIATSYSSDEAGGAQVRLTVVDENGESDSDIITITVVNRAQVGSNQLDERVVFIIEGSNQRIVQREENGRVVLAADQFEIILPEGVEDDFRVSLSEDEKIMIALPQEDRVVMIDVPQDELEGEIDLDDLQGNENIIIEWNAPEDLDEDCEFGAQIQAQDINGDGEAEVMIGADCGDGNDEVIIFDDQGEQQARVQEQAEGTTVKATDNGIAIGPIQAAGDDQLQFNDPNEDQDENSNSIFLFEEDDLEDLDNIASDNAPISIELDEEEGIKSFIVGDLDGDGNQDVVLVTDTQKVIVFFNDSLNGNGIDEDDADVVINDAPENINFGHSLMMADINGNGDKEIIIGAPNAGESEEGAVIVLFVDSSVPTVDFDDSNHIIVYGDEAGDQIGSDLLEQDENEDGFFDILTVTSDGNSVLIDFGINELEDEVNELSNTSSTSASLSSGCSLDSSANHKGSILIIGLWLIILFMSRKRFKFSKI